MENKIIFFLTVFIFIVVGIQMLRGKWLMLIAGYNTSSKEEKKKINGRNLGKLVGTFFLWIALLTTLQFFSLINNMLFLSLLFCSLIFLLIFSNASKLFKR